METVLLITLIILAFALALAGIAFCVLPVLPGPPLSFGGLLLLDWSLNWEPFGGRFLIIMGAMMLLVTTLDGIIPLLGARRYGASKAGIWGSVIGMLVGIFFIPPWGIIIGAFVGALAGEMLSGKKGNDAVRVGWGIFVGTMAGIGLKLAYCAATLGFLVFGLV